MASTVEGYLAELRTALAGADPALVQDAMYDAEEYLRSAVAEAGGTPEAQAAAIDAYGTPQEVADAYRQAEDTVAAALRRPQPAARKSAFGQSVIGRFFGVIVDPTRIRGDVLRAARARDRNAVLHRGGDRLVAHAWAHGRHHHRTDGPDRLAALHRHGARDLAGRRPDGGGAARRAHAQKAADVGRSGQPLGAHQVVAVGLPHVDHDAVHDLAAAARHHLLHADGHRTGHVVRAGGVPAAAAGVAPADVRRRHLRVLHPPRRVSADHGARRPGLLPDAVACQGHRHRPRHVGQDDSCRPL